MRLQSNLRRDGLQDYSVRQIDDALFFLFAEELRGRVFT
jgi:hypothetical protein